MQCVLGLSGFELFLAHGTSFGPSTKIFFSNMTAGNSLVTRMTVHL